MAIDNDYRQGAPSPRPRYNANVGLGLLLILIFSRDLATVLTATGLLVVYAGQFFARVPLPLRILQIRPLINALVVTLQALHQTGLLAL